MPSRATTAPPAAKLTWPQVNAFRLKGQYLSKRAPKRNWEHVVSALGAAHGQLMSAAELSICARAEGVKPDDVRTALWEKRRLVKTWGMRGTLHLFTEDPAQPGYRFMRYGMRLTAQSGRAYWLHGMKHIGNDSILRAWHDCTTLYTTVYDGPDRTAKVLGLGIIRLDVGDAVDLVESIEPTNTHGFIQRWSAVFRFARYFLGAEVDVYLRKLRF